MPVKLKQTAVYRGFQVAGPCTSLGKQFLVPPTHHSNDNEHVTLSDNWNRAIQFSLCPALWKSIFYHHKLTQEFGGLENPLVMRFSSEVSLISLVCSLEPEGISRSRGQASAT